MLKLFHLVSGVVYPLLLISSLFVDVCSCLNYVAMVVSRLQLRCTERSTAATGFTIGYIVAYARASTPLQSRIWESTCVTAPPCMYV